MKPARLGFAPALSWMSCFGRSRPTGLSARDRPALRQVLLAVLTEAQRGTDNPALLYASALRSMPQERRIAGAGSPNSRPQDVAGTYP